jgi:hypothetical protein
MRSPDRRAPFFWNGTPSPTARSITTSSVTPPDRRDWYRRLTGDAAAEWFSSRQIGWVERLDREGPNLREAMEFGLTDSLEVASRMASNPASFTRPTAC